MAETTEHMSPSEADQSNESTALKRRQSDHESIQSPESKRARLSSRSKSRSRSQTPPAVKTEPPRSSESLPQDERRLSRGRAPALDTDKKRNKRLFGSLLQTISQKPNSSQQNRRAEVEQKQLEKARVHREQEAREATKRAEKLKAARRLKQERFDEISARHRQSNKLTMARFLATKASPRIYYLPWSLLPSQKEILEAQIKDAEAQIAEDAGKQPEHDDHEPTKEPVDKKLRGENTVNQDSNTQDNSTVESTEPASDKADALAHSESERDPVKPTTIDNNAEKEADDRDYGGEVVMDEDTVIY